METLYFIYLFFTLGNKIECKFLVKLAFFNNAKIFFICIAKNLIISSLNFSDL